jgi:sec-independent protein translocase protein TatC
MATKTLHDDDLFKDSTMTFGEHLDELRRCLFKAVLGLFVGCLIGLWCADWVVKVIESPLKRALERYYAEEFIERYPNAADQVQDQQFAGKVFDPVYVEPGAILDQLKQSIPALGSIELSEKQRSTLVPLRIWRDAEDDSRTKVKSLSVQEPFMIWLKAALLAGGILSSPWLFYQIWNFVAAGLYPHEKKYVHVFLPFSLILFLSGAALAFLFVFDPVLNVLFSFNRSLGIAPEPRINEWLGFVLMMPLGFGIAFQLPLVMLFLDRIGIFTVHQYLSYWRVAILTIFIISAVLTPADPYSIFFMAIPLCLLYFGGVLICRYLPGTRNRYAQSGLRPRD